MKKSFLYVLIGSVVLSALLGILAILSGDFGEFEARILLTALTISGASLFGLSCGAALESGRVRVLPVFGVTLAMIAALLIITGVWGEFRSEPYWKTTATFGMFAAACTQMALLLMTRLAPRHAWTRQAAAFIVFSLPAILSVILWREIQDEMAFRLLGVAIILDGAITILIPILHRLSRDEVFDSSANLAELDEEIACVRARLQKLEQTRQRLLSAEATPDRPAPLQNGTSSRSPSRPMGTDSGIGPKV